MDLFKEIVPSLLEKNNYLYDESDSSSYNPFIVNRALSAHIDCIPYISEINLYKDVPKRIHYDYLFYSIRKYKRQYQKWVKPTEYDNIDIIMEYYNFSKEKALEVLGILTSEQIDHMKQSLEKGGKS